MLTIITGQPGAGKTLLLIDEIVRITKDKPRPVFYHGINGLDDSLGWKQFDDPFSLHQLPVGSIILIDEAWEHFPAVPAGAKRPKYIEDFATHRHRGHDIYFTMQHTTQLDTFPRKMCGRHIHVHRIFGLERAKILEWDGIGNPDDFHSKKSALTRTWSYPKGVYDLYTSAEIHTVQRRVPVGKFAMIGGGTLAAIGLAVFAVKSLTGGGDEVSTIEQSTASTPIQNQSSPVRIIAGALDSGKPPQGRPGLYDLETWRPELAGMEYTALFYDELIEPVSFPKPSCLNIVVHYSSGRTENQCSCSSQQGTKLPQIRQAQCIFIAENGWFDFTLPDDALGQQEREPAEPMGAAPAAGSL